jgi:uracil-DNA glycosylase family 4
VSLESIHHDVIHCRRCPRLVHYRETIARLKTRRFESQEYWGRPVPGFGVARARLLVVGLAPAAHGGNRTGRIFTGDRSGDWLYESLYRYGFASSPFSIARDDGLRVRKAYICAVARCAPPGNKPTLEEMDNCRSYLLREIEILRQVRVVVALGRIAFDGFLAAWRERGGVIGKPRPKFSHGSEHLLPSSSVTLLGSYHPSQQNTFTGKLTRPMLHGVFRRARALIEEGVARPSTRS